MRKFRGKRVDNGWVYGYYVVIGDTHWIAERDVEFRTHELDEADYGERPETGIYGMVEVIPETIEFNVGEFWFSVDLFEKMTMQSCEYKKKLHDNPMEKENEKEITN